MGHLGANMKRLRKRNKLSQQKLGELIGASQTSVAHYEAGTREPTIETLKSLSKIFNVTVDALIGHQVYHTTSQTVKEEKEDISSLLLQALLDKDDRLFLDLFTKHVINVYRIAQIMDRIFKDVLYQIGSMWNEGVISEADEHYASNQIRKAINYISVMNMDVIKTRSAVTFSVGSEKHTIGIEMVNTYIETLGVQSIYLGTNLPYKSIENIINDYQPNYVFISITLSDHINSLMQLIDYINEKANEDITIIIGGQAYLDYDIKHQYDNVIHIKTLEEIDALIR